MKGRVFLGVLGLTSVAVVLSVLFAHRSTRAWQYREDVQDEIDLYRLRGGRGR